VDTSRWPHADALLDEALALPPDEREAFVRRAAEDPELVAALLDVLAEATSADGFLEPGGALSGPLVETLSGDTDPPESRRLQPGQSIGVYRVIDWLGRGGMGEVYRAHDGSLGRDVALKILPSDVAGDSGRLARLRREARLLASLNHPNIGAIYHVVDEDGVLALVLELVEGPTLAERLRGGALSIGEALALARQIGEASTPRTRPAWSTAI
jgi:serine/threonine-protein kinase